MGPETYHRYTLDRMFELTGAVKLLDHRVSIIEARVIMSPASSPPPAKHGIIESLTHAVHVGHLATEISRMVVRAILWLIPRIVTYGGALYGAWTAFRATHPL
jgi:hypothetical protein